MRIAQIAPLWERVPPPAYGGVELVVSLLTEELVKRGHEVTLFASGDSITQANLVSTYPHAIRLDPNVQEYAVYEALQLGEVFSRANEFDVIHSHVGYTALPYASLVKTPVVHTLHGRFTTDNERIFSQYRNQNYVSISHSQRQLRDLNYIATVYNAIAVETHHFYPQPSDPPYLAFLGRLSPEKGPHHAIEIAKRVGIPLRMAGKVDRVDRDYFKELIEPHIDGEFIQFIGEADHPTKNALLGGAIAMLFPITWQEPFGLVMIESMAAGTPVVAIAKGAAPEVIEHGKTGFLCHSVEDCVAAVAQVPQLDRMACRDYVWQRFSVERMVSEYEAVYDTVLANTFLHNGHRRGTIELLAS
ncbi:MULTISPECIES: glycosyltransferase family 4 protein [unclassified Thermosynechococcus]|uniref:glycosyltransferase family 4 protein n=1 Tax=unclassified Thermosynechococcus TaxID=2622553 RepID=UPI0019F79EF1|nr:MULTISPECIES: glycosyltransferase family 4 protein [unclassified Thermosynechococcus]HIK35544.1 glycosyltransferase family 4 protein [Thermosynechococcus sp. M98_K2018_005]HIK47874.1 glycosyltransferase family 4 protein [Thermosynechococcus sp. M55_K2018_012]